MGYLEHELDISQIDRVILTSLKDERQSIFQNWAEAIINENWNACDNCPILLLQTLSYGRTCRLKLSKWHENKNEEYKNRLADIDRMLEEELDPLNAEQIKGLKPELDKQKALQTRDCFYQVFKNNNLIDAT